MSHVVRPLTSADHAAVLTVARALPAWFTERGVRHIDVDLGFQEGFVAEAEGQVVGFVSLYVAEGVGHIGWMGVLPDRHRRGVGRSLCAAVEKRLRIAGVDTLRVQTLGDAVDYEPYARTRSFYRGVGFTDWKREETGDPECPEQLTLAKTIGGAG